MPYYAAWGNGEEFFRNPPTSARMFELFDKYLPITGQESMAKRFKEVLNFFKPSEDPSERDHRYLFPRYNAVVLGWTDQKSLDNLLSDLTGVWGGTNGNMVVRRHPLCDKNVRLYGARIQLDDGDKPLYVAAFACLPNPPMKPWDYDFPGDGETLVLQSLLRSPQT